LYFWFYNWEINSASGFSEICNFVSWLLLFVLIIHGYLKKGIGPYLLAAVASLIIVQCYPRAMHAYREHMIKEASIETTAFVTKAKHSRKVRKGMRAPSFRFEYFADGEWFEKGLFHSLNHCEWAPQPGDTLLIRYANLHPNIVKIEAIKVDGEWIDFIPR
jgi:hypothetical protein